MKCPECGCDMHQENDENVCYSCGYQEPAELDFENRLYDEYVGDYEH